MYIFLGLFAYLLLGTISIRLLSNIGYKETDRVINGVYRTNLVNCDNHSNPWIFSNTETMSIILMIWYIALVIADFGCWISFPLFAANLIALMIMALIFLG